jgi:tetratricopeptide (TPR) repeat protein
MTPTRHLTDAELNSLAEPGLAPVESQHLAAHLFSCPSCWTRATEPLLKLDLAVSPSGKDRAFALQVERDSSLSALLSRFRLERKSLEDRLLAQALLGVLKPAKRKSRKEILGKRTVRKSRALVDELLAESRRSLPVEAEEWATLAMMVGDQLSSTEYPDTLKQDVRAECFVEIAAGRRRCAKWKSAREAIAEGREIAARGTRSISIEGSFLAVDGAIDDDLGNVEEADQKLMEAKDCFERSGDSQLLARTLIQLGYIWMDADPHRSLGFIAKVEPMITPDDKRLQILAETTRIDCLITVGKVAEALSRYMQLSSVWDQFSDPFFQLRRRFAAGRLLEGLGRFEEADALFREVIAVDLEQRSVKALYLDYNYVFGSYVRRGDFEAAGKICGEALSQLPYLDLDASSENQMRELWEGLSARAKERAVGEKLVLRSRRFIRSQWRTQTADPLATKESAV